MDAAFFEILDHLQQMADRPGSVLLKIRLQPAARNSSICASWT